MGKHNSEPKPINTTKDTATTFEGTEELLWGCSDQNSQQETKSVVQNQKHLVFLMEENFPQRNPQPPPSPPPLPLPLPPPRSLHTAVFLKLTQWSGW